MALKQMANGPELRRSDMMAKRAMEFYDKLQEDGLENRPTEDATREILSGVSNNLDAPQVAMLNNRITRYEVQEALRVSASGKATGLDGIPYEVWKFLQEDYEKTKDSDSPAMNITEFLTKVFNHIEENGVLAGTNFAEGWICPLYKKKDRRDIADYRPITLLNADYKIYTKILTMRLS